MTDISWHTRHKFIGLSLFLVGILLPFSFSDVAGDLYTPGWLEFISYPMSFIGALFLGSHGGDYFLGLIATMAATLANSLFAANVIFIHGKRKILNWVVMLLASCYVGAFWIFQIYKKFEIEQAWNNWQRYNLLNDVSAYKVFMMWSAKIHLGLLLWFAGILVYSLGTSTRRPLQSMEREGMRSS